MEEVMDCRLEDYKLQIEVHYVYLIATDKAEE